MKLRDLNKRPYRFRVYNLACGFTLLLGLALGVVGYFVSVRTETQVIVAPMALPTGVQALIASDPQPRSRSALSAEITHRVPTVEGIDGTRSHWRIRLDGHTANLPADTTKWARRRFPTMVDALREMGSHGRRTYLLISAELTAAKAQAIEDGICVGIEMAFFDGLPSAHIPSLSEFLDRLVAQIAAISETGVGAERVDAVAVQAALDYLALPASYAKGVAENDASTALRERRREFEAQPMLGDARGLWASDPARQAAWRAMRALMMPASPAAASAILVAMRRHPDSAAHYRRWLAVRHALYGPTSRSASTIAAFLDGREWPAQPTSLLAWRDYLPADWLVAAAREAIHGRGETIDALHPASAQGIVETLAVRATNRTLGALPGVPGWDDWRLWARIPALPAGILDTETDAGETTQPGVPTPVAFGRGYKAVRIAGRFATMQLVERTIIEPMGLSCAPELASLGDPEIRLDPLPRLYLRLSRSFRAVPVLLAPMLDESDLDAMDFAWGAPRRSATSVRSRLHDAAGFFAALHQISCAELGLPSALRPDESPTEQDRTWALLWRDGELTADPDLQLPLCDAHPIDIRDDGATVWLGVRGAIFQPMELSVFLGPTDDAQPRPVLMPILDRRIYVTPSGIPSRARWQFISTAGTERLLPALFE